MLQPGRDILHNQWAVNLWHSWELFVKSNSITSLVMTQFNAIITDGNIRIFNRSFYSDTYCTYGLVFQNFSGDFRTEVISMKFEEFAKIWLLLSAAEGGVKVKWRIWKYPKMHPRYGQNFISLEYFVRREKSVAKIQLICLHKHSFWFITILVVSYQ